MNAVTEQRKVLLEIADLKVHFDIKDGKQWFWQPSKTLKAVDGVTLRLYEGETLGVVGESGCGKSTFARAIIGLVKATDGKVAGWVRSAGHEAGRVARRAQRYPDDLRGSAGLAEPAHDHRRNYRRTAAYLSSEDAPSGSARSRQSDDDESWVAAQPDQPLSARVLRRSVSAYRHRAGADPEPKLIICDEPVSALDVSIQAQVVNLLQQLQREMGLSLIFIAHDLAVVKHISDRVLVMYLGHAVELGTYDEVYHNPLHPYTKALMSAVPIPDPDLEKTKTIQLLEGELPSPINPPSGCVFRTRCPLAGPECAKTRPVLEGSFRHAVSCLKVDPL